MKSSGNGDGNVTITLARFNRERKFLKISFVYASQKLLIAFIAKVSVRVSLLNYVLIHWKD